LDFFFLTFSFWAVNSWETLSIVKVKSGDTIDDWDGEAGDDIVSSWEADLFFRDSSVSRFLGEGIAAGANIFTVSLCSTNSSINDFTSWLNLRHWASNGWKTFSGIKVTSGDSSNNWDCKTFGNCVTSWEADFLS
jgi:hypothetical protein